MIKIKLILLIFFITAISLFSQSYNNIIIYRDYGIWSYKINNSNIISIHAYVLRKTIIKSENHEIKEKTTSYIPGYRYELTLESKSICENNKTNTLLYGTKIYINNQEVTKDTFKDGFIASIKTEPTLIYWYETSNDSINFTIEWEKSLAQPK